MSGSSSGLLAGFEEPSDQVAAYTKLLDVTEVDSNVRPNRRRSSIFNVTSVASAKGKMVVEQTSAVWRWANAFVIMPEMCTKRVGAHWVECWDVLMVFVLVEQAYHVPLELALTFHNARWHVVFQLFLIAIFTFDLVLQFFISYMNHSYDLTDELWEKDFKKIAIRYCGVPFSYKGRGGWFWIDFLSILPGYIFLLSWFVTGLESLERHIQCLTLLRILRLVLKLRMRRWIRFLARVHSIAAFPYYIYDLVLLFVVSTCACHWFACGWLMLEGKITHGVIHYHNSKSWLSVMIDQKGDPCFPNASEDAWCTYVLALYWAVVSVTSVGYGDIVPQNRMEYFVAGAFLLIAGYVWAYIVGAVVSLLSSLDPRGAGFKRSMDDLNDLMDEKGVPNPLQVRLRRYMHEADGVKREEEQIQFLESTISQGLQREVVHTSKNMQLLQGIYWTKGLLDDVRLELVKAFRPIYYPSNEIIITKQIIIVIFNGMILWKGFVLKRGDTWGHDNILLTSPELMDKAEPRTITPLSAMIMTKSSLVRITDDFPDLSQRLRKAQIKVALYRKVVLMTRAHKKKRKDNLCSPVSTVKNNDLDIAPHTPSRRPGSGASYARRVATAAFSEHASGAQRDNSFDLRTHIDDRVDALEECIQNAEARILDELSAIRSMLVNKDGNEGDN